MRIHGVIPTALKIRRVVHGIEVRTLTTATERNGDDVHQPKQPLLTTHTISQKGRRLRKSMLPLLLHLETLLIDEKHSFSRKFLHKLFILLKIFNNFIKNLTTTC